MSNLSLEVQEEKKPSLAIRAFDKINSEEVHDMAQALAMPAVMVGALALALVFGK